MKNSKFVLLGLLSTVLLVATGCGGNRSPDGVVGEAARAADKYDLDGLRSNLTGKALDEYGNLQGLAKLHSKFDTLKSLTGKLPKLTTEVGDLGAQTYTVDLKSNFFDGPVRVMRATVVCKGHNRISHGDVVFVRDRCYITDLTD